MDVILIPGFWLDGSSWRAQVPALERAGHRVHAPTLPGLAPGDSTDVGLADHIAAIVELIDAAEGSVALVAHSNGGAVAWGAADARPAVVEHVVFVDGFPPPDDASVDLALSAEGGVVPFPRDPASFFGAAELKGFSDDEFARFVSSTIPHPARVAREPIRLHDDERWRIPVTVIASSFPSDVLEQMIDSDHPITSELSAIAHRRFVDLTAGRWPQITHPDDTSHAIVDALEG